MTKDTKVEAKKQTNPNTASDNKAVFGPLAKYAVIAVIMVSIIVTTAIMLDKQLNTVDQKIAAIESEVAAMNDYAEPVIAEDPVIAQIESSNDTASAETAVTETQATIAEATPVVSTEISTEKQVSVQTPVAEIQAKETTDTAQISEQSTPVITAVANEQKIEQQTNENQARIDAYKIEHKQHLAEMFARIKTLEGNQLTQYKNTQDKQIGRLRTRVSQQQVRIDTQILRNKDIFEMRAANVQRNQTNREEILNRI